MTFIIITILIHFLKAVCLLIGISAIFSYIETMIRYAVYGKVRKIWEPFTIAVCFSLFYLLNQL
jgi:hypothetical protein